MSSRRWDLQAEHSILRQDLHTTPSNNASEGDNNDSATPERSRASSSLLHESHLGETPAKGASSASARGRRTSRSPSTNSLSACSAAEESSFSSANSRLVSGARLLSVEL